jgi:hypothetical protein
MSDDTTPEAHAVQMVIYRRMSGDRRVALLEQMSEEAREITRAGLRRQFPELDEREIIHRERQRRLGAALADAVWPQR